MSKPLVSVITPVYNTEEWVWEAIESILNQTFKEFEFIIIDDCSTDWSYAILDDYAKKDKRIRLYRNEKNSWISYTRNRLISLTTTDYIATQDSDDVSTHNRLKLEYEFLSKHDKYWVVAWDNEIIDEEGKVIGHRKYSDNVQSVILKKSPVSNPTTMFRKSFLEEVWWYEEWLNYWEDYDVWLKFYLNWYKIKNIDKVLLKYRVRKWQTKSDKLKQTLRNTIKLQEKYIKLWIKPSISDRIYIFLEKCLLMLPSNIVLWLFKILSY
jgi:glycosyltransferase involved in cell wall biosynthesis